LTRTAGRNTISAGTDFFHRHRTERSAFFQSPAIGFNGQYDTGVPFADFLLGNADSMSQGGKSDWINNYFNQAAFVQNNDGTPGDSPKFFIQSPPDRDMDLSFIKNFSMRERYRIHFRWEMFNATNTPSYGLPDNNPTDPNFGQIGGIGPCAPRVIQAALKINF